MNLVYTSHTESVIGDKQYVTQEQIDKMLLAIAKKMYKEGDIILSEKVEDDITSTEVLARYYKIKN